jgi:predicted anti-sigma-YlaC factor YlaD
MVVPEATRNRERTMTKPRILLFALTCLLALSGCSIRQVAVSRLADTLAAGGSVYASDNDPELVGEALPFSLKTIEGLLLEVPEHRGLLLTAASGFTQYSYAWVDLESFVIEDSDPHRAGQLKRRAKNLYLRGRAYALRAVQLQFQQPDFVGSLRRDAQGTLSRFSKENIPELYWLALSWAAAIASDTSDMDLVADLNLVDAIMRRCLELDEGYDDGALHEFMIAWQGGRSPLQGGGADSARQHFARAVGLSGDLRIGGLVSLAESVSVTEQNRAEFEQLLDKALAFNVDAHPPTRLANLVAQRRARVLLSRADNFFLED